MISASRNDNLAGPGVMSGRPVLTLVQGEVRLAPCSSSLFVALRLLVSNSNAQPRTVDALFTYVPAIAPYKTAKQTFRGLVTWRDTSKARYTLPYGELVRATKTCVSQTALALLREMFLSVVRHIVTQPDTTRGIISSSHPSASLPFNWETLQVPYIIVTPPDDESSASLNIIPVPQNAAFGNQLVVPDPEFKVINRGSPPDPFQTSLIDSPRRVDEQTDASDIANGCKVPGCLSLEEDGEEDVVALGLGPTWSG